MDYNSIKTPKELLKFMSNNISYGYFGKNGKIYNFDDEDFNKKWKDEYILESSEDVLKNKIGTCWDQVEFERDWFSKHNYEFKTIYHQVILNYDNPYPTHTFLVYKENDKWYWFENAWDDQKGIHEFNTFDELLKFEYQKYLKKLKEYSIKDEEIAKIKYFEYSKPNSHINVINYLKHIINNKKTLKMLTIVDKFQTENGRTRF